MKLGPSCCFILLSFLSSLLIAITTCSAEGNDTDISALLDFKSRLMDVSDQILGSWNSTVNFCQWRGVTCGTRQRRVTILDLASLKLVGSIPPSIGNMTFLREIHLQGNKLTGTIAAEIGLLRRLEVLRLYNNSLTGNVPPSLANCSNLVSVSIAFNNLVGRIPYELGSLSKLEFISLSANNLSGPIPSSFGNLSSLNILSIAKNSLYGSIPDSLGQLSNIRGIGIGVNNLSDTIPPSIFNLSTLTVLDLGYNSFDGSLPPDLFATLPNLQNIGLGFNLMAGPIPSSISNATNLVQFEAVVNLFSGAMPLLGKLSGLQFLTISSNNLGTGGEDDMDFLYSLINATSLQRLDFHNNNFGGYLPEEVSNFSTSLIDLSLGNNRISGKIPSGIGNLVNLQGLDMWGNGISGTIPSGIGNLQQLVTVFFDSNSLSVYIPPSFGNLTLLTDLRLGNNNLQGQIPPSLGLLQNLGYLELSRNNLNGSIPIEIFRLSSLSIGLDLSQNNLSGALPLEIGSLKNLGALDVSGNELSGEIPGSLGSCTSLERVSLARNNFRGKIPESLGQLGAIQVLDLSWNNLSGEIPQFLARLKLLQVLNLSHNHFEGDVPIDGVFGNASAVILTGNDKLCGGSAKLNLPECISKSKKRSTALKLVVSIVPTVLGVSLLALFLFLCLFKKKQTKDRTHSVSSKTTISAVSYFTLLKATDGFSEERLIGSGAFGSVYKGISTVEGEGEKVIAVKVLNLQNPGAFKSFLAECEALRNIRHRNLVKVVTACSGIDGKENDFKAIVYEFLPNGSLENWLHRTNNEQAGQLSLIRRLSVAIDVAVALDYLHHRCEVPVVHCDLKPSNVLLDEEMVARVGDFGLAKFILEEEGKLSASLSSSIGIRGSTGYVAPEYGMGSEVSTSGDVYSYGILLLELFIGKRPTDDMFDESMDLHSFAEKALSGNYVKEICDPVLIEEIHRTGETADKQGCLVSVFRIGVACSSKLPTDRMDIADVVAEMNSLRTKLIPRRSRGVTRV